MKLSVLDPVQKPKGKTSSQALQASIALAQAVEALGFQRYWVVEHHGVDFEADPAPEVFVAAIAQATKTIRVGAGGLLLNNYSPYKSAESMRTLEALFPGRIDVGIGRSISGVKQDTALRRLREHDIPDDHEAQVSEFVAWLGNDIPESSPFHGLTIMADEPAGPKPWILAVSEESAERAGRHGLALACSAFHQPEKAPKAIAAYRNSFKPSTWRAGLQNPEILLAVRMVIGETQEEAERLAMPMRAVFKLRREDKIFLSYLPSIEEAEEILGGHQKASEADWPDNVIGTPERVAAILRRMSAQTGASEFMLQDFLDDPNLRLRNYELISRELRG
jgi:luciferase family oxidoreductase group 1